MADETNAYKDGTYKERITRAKELLATARHMALATVNPDGSPHNSPVFFAFDSDLNFYWASGQQTQHSQNIARGSKVFAVLFDSHSKGGGLYVLAQAQALSGDELAAGLAVFNARLTVLGRPNVDRTMYEGDGTERLYKANPVNIWVNVTERTEDGRYINEYRREVDAKTLQETV